MKICTVFRRRMLTMTDRILLDKIGNVIPFYKDTQNILKHDTYPIKKCFNTDGL